jgi:serine/threonine protein kinase
MSAGIPKRIGRFLILSIEAAGGMGVVSHAVDPEDEKPVAVKVLPEAFGRRPEFAKRGRRVTYSGSSGFLVGRFHVISPLSAHGELVEP